MDLPSHFPFLMNASSVEGRIEHVDMSLSETEKCGYPPSSTHIYPLLPFLKKHGEDQEAAAKISFPLLLRIYPRTFATA